MIDTTVGCVFCAHGGFAESRAWFECMEPACGSVERPWVLKQSRQLKSDLENRVHKSEMINMMISSYKVY